VWYNVFERKPNLTKGKMPYEKHYTGIRDNIQVFFRNKNSENIYAAGDKTPDGDNNSDVNDRIQGKNGKFREI